MTTESKPDITMTDKSDTQAEDPLRFWTREELLIRAEGAEAEIDVLWAKMVAMHYIDVQARAEAAEAEQQRDRDVAARWIPVSEPPDGGFIEDAEYIVLSENAAGSAYVTAARYMKGKRGLPGAWVQGDGYLYEVKNVTGWQDMPAPPTKAEEWRPS